MRRSARRCCTPSGEAEQIVNPTATSVANSCCEVIAWVLLPLAQTVSPRRRTSASCCRMQLRIIAGPGLSEAHKQDKHQAVFISVPVQMNQTWYVETNLQAPTTDARLSQVHLRAARAHVCGQGPGLRDRVDARQGARRQVPGHRRQRRRQHPGHAGQREEAVPGAGPGRVAPAVHLPTLLQLCSSGGEWQQRW